MNGKQYIKGLCSVCCLGYNHAKFIEENIQALWVNDYKSIEIIVVDDGSTDNSVEILKALALISPYPMRIIPQANTGNIGKNFNVAFSHAQGEFVFFMSIDDVLLNDAISSKMSLMKDDAKVALVGNTSILKINDDSSELGVELLPTATQHIDSFSDLLELEYSKFGAFYLQGTCIRSDIVALVAGFDETMTGDDIVLRCKVFSYLSNKVGYKFILLNQPACRYRIHDSNIHKNTLRQLKIVTEVLELFFPNRPPPQELVAWVGHYSSLQEFDKLIEFFAINKYASKLLTDYRIKALLKQKLNNQFIPPANSKPNREGKYKRQRNILAVMVLSLMCLATYIAIF